MPFQHPKLPYAADALSPFISKETVEFHYGKHHKKYVDTLNKLVQGTALENSMLETIIREQSGEIFNNAAQVWNHTFYWKCLSPQGGGEPQGYIAAEIQKEYGGFQSFCTQFTLAATTLFGSGWVWLVKKKTGELEIWQTKDAENPMTQGAKPLLVCDVWEHAYYIDYRNYRPKYLESFWKLVNWEFAEKQLKEEVVYDVGKRTDDQRY